MAGLELENVYRAGREQFQMKGREMVWVFKRNRSRWEEGERKGGREAGREGRSRDTERAELLLELW